MKTGKTTTITIHHDRCDVSQWTLADWQALMRFVKDPGLHEAAALSRRGMQLVLSEKFEPKGGELQQIGFCRDESPYLPLSETSDDLSEVVDDALEVEAVVPIYRGPTQYAVKFGTATHDGEFDGYDYETFKTEADADAFIESMKAQAEEQPA